MKQGSLVLLLVEDDDIDREAVCRLLDQNHIVIHAATGQEALAALEVQQPDAVLLDYMLPDMVGLDLVGQLVQRYVPVILLTGQDSPELIVEAMQMGAQDFMVKGHITRSSLDRAIGNAVEKVALRRDLAERQAQLAAQAAELERSNRQVRALASALTLAEQRERRRISQILHDHVQQMLYGIQMRVFLIGMELPESVRSELAEHLEEIANLLDQAISTTRTLTVELSPPVLNSEGLGSALTWLAHQMAKTHDLDVKLNLGVDYTVPSEDLRVLIIQLVRELLFNVVKHAGVDCARVTMDVADGRLNLRIEDDGIGFCADQLIPAAGLAPRGGFGLYSVRERLALFGGSLRVDSSPGVGTCVEIALPIAVKLNGDGQGVEVA
jgi:signal transduction histidine kinase